MVDVLSPLPGLEIVGMDGSGGLLAESSLHTPAIFWMSLRLVCGAWIMYSFLDRRKQAIQKHQLT